MWVKTADSLFNFDFEAATFRSYFDNKAKYKIKDLNWMQLGDKPIIVVHEPAARRDIIVAINKNSEE